MQTQTLSVWTREQREDEVKWRVWNLQRQDNRVICTETCFILQVKNGTKGDLEVIRAAISTIGSRPNRPWREGYYLLSFSGPRCLWLVPQKKSDSKMLWGWGVILPKASSQRLFFSLKNLKKFALLAFVLSWDLSFLSSSWCLLFKRECFSYACPTIILGK